MLFFGLIFVKVGLIVASSPQALID